MTSGITPSHSAVPTGLPQKKKKKNPHFTHTTKEKNRLHLHSTKKKTLYLPPNSSRCAKQSRVPLVAPPSLPALIFFPLPRLHCSRALPLLSCFSSTCLMGRRYSVVAGNERGSEKCGEFTESRCEPGKTEKNGKNEISRNVRYRLNRPRVRL